MATAVALLYTLPASAQGASPLPSDGQPTATIGDFITPVSAKGTPGQAGTGREPSATINGSGLRESSPGSGVFVHGSNPSADGAAMWNTGGGKPRF